MFNILVFAHFTVTLIILGMIIIDLWRDYNSEEGLSLSIRDGLWFMLGLFLSLMPVMNIVFLIGALFYTFEDKLDAKYTFKRNGV